MWGSSRYSILLCSFNARFRILFASKRFSNTGKGTIIRREKALKSQLLKGIRVNKILPHLTTKQHKRTNTKY